MVGFSQWGNFPQTRLRRLRQTAWIRDLVAENDLRPQNLILPVFVRAPSVSPRIDALPGVKRYTLEELLSVCEEALALGIRALALFPVIESQHRTASADEALNPDGLLIQAIQKTKCLFPELGLITDVSLDAFSLNGHDGLTSEGRVLNDETLEVLGKAAVLQAQAGSDVIAPSDMMDGRVGFIRQALDQAASSQTQILAYAVKYASSFYAPFREALGSASCLGGSNKKSYQMDPRNEAEALREVSLDLSEGADMLLVKPGMPYLDVICRLRQNFPVPIWGYQVSGEYAMLKAASQAGWLSYPLVLMESLMSFKRAGAHAIMTYAALDAASFLSEGFSY